MVVVIVAVVVAFVALDTSKRNASVWLVGLGYSLAVEHNFCGDNGGSICGFGKCYSSGGGGGGGDSFGVTKQIHRQLAKCKQKKCFSAAGVFL